jgi:hypothetical protein
MNRFVPALTDPNFINFVNSASDPEFDFSVGDQEGSGANDFAPPAEKTKKEKRGKKRKTEEDDDPDYVSSSQEGKKPRSKRHRPGVPTSSSVSAEEVKKLIKQNEDLEKKLAAATAASPPVPTFAPIKCPGCQEEIPAVDTIVFAACAQGKDTIHGMCILCFKQEAVRQLNLREDLSLVPSADGRLGQLLNIKIKGANEAFVNNIELTFTSFKCPTCNTYTGVHLFNEQTHGLILTVDRFRGLPGAPEAIRPQAKSRHDCTHDLKVNTKNQLLFSLSVCVQS